MSQSARSVAALLITGTVIWALAGVISIAINAPGKIIWTCVIGVGLGFVGLRYTLRRSRRVGL